MAQGETVASHQKFDWIAQWRQVAHGHRLAGHQPHLEREAAGAAVAAHTHDDAMLPRMQAIQGDLHQRPGNGQQVGGILASSPVFFRAHGEMLSARGRLRANCRPATSTSSAPEATAVFDITGHCANKTRVV